MVYFAKDDLLYIHSRILGYTQGIDEVRGEGMLLLASNVPLQTFGGQDLYPTLNEKFARLSYSLTLNHPFFGGNKRIGAFALSRGLEINGVSLTCSDAEMISIFLGLAGCKLDYTTFLAWVNENAAPKAAK